MKSICCQCGKLMQIDSNRAVARKRCDLLFSLFCDQFYRTLADVNCLEVSGCFNCDTSEFLCMDKQGIEFAQESSAVARIVAGQPTPRLELGLEQTKTLAVTSGHQRLSQVDFGLTIDLPCFLQEAQSGTKHSAVANLGQHFDS